MMKTTIKKAISLTTVVCFLMAESVSAAPAVGITLMPQRETPAFLQIEIPEELASVEEIYEAPPKQDPRLIIHIQNAHSHYEAQMKIKKLLEYLREQYGFTLFFVEGAAEKLDPKYLDLFPEKEKNLELADQLTKKGQLTGIDYYLMDDPGKSVALGIEKADLYRQDIRAFRDVQSSRDLANAFFDDFERQMETIGSRRFGEDLRRLLGEWKKFEQGRRDFLPHVKRIARDAKRIMGLDLESLFAQVEWPHVTRLLVLQSMEKEIDFEKAEKEKADLIQFLEQIKTDKGLIEDVRDLGERKISMARMTASGKEKERMPRYLLERLVEEAGPKGFYFHDFPAFSLYAGYLILKSELETRALFSEIERIFTKLLDELAVREEEKNLLEIHRDLDLLKKLMQLELTREDWTRTDYRKEWINPRTMARRLESIRDLGVITKEQKARSALMDQGESLSKPFDRAFDFYRYAQERERNFYQTISKEMDERHIEKAVLITGGFHTEGLMDMFREGEINYGVLMPKITTKGDAANYLNAMLETDSTIFDFATIEIISRLQSAAQMTLQDADLTHQVKVVVDAYFRVLQEVGVRDYDTWRRYIQYFNDSPYAQENKIRVVAQSEGLDSAMIEVNGRPIQTPSGENALLQFKLVKPNMWADEVTMVVSVSGVQKLAEQVQSRRRTMPQGLGNIGKPISSGLKQGAMVRETVVDIGSVTVEAGTLVAKRSEFREQGAQVLQMGDSIFVSKQIADWMASQNLLNETRTPGDIQVMQGATRLGFASQEVVSTLTQAWSIASSHSGLWEGSVPGLQYGNDIFVSSQVADWMTKEGLLSKESIPDGFRIMLGETLIGFASRSAVWQLRENWTIETTFPSERQGLIQGRVVQVDNSIFVNDAVRDWMVREGLLSKESIPDGFRIMLGETLIGFASLSAVGQLRENGAIATALRSELREGAVTRSEVRSIAGVYNWQAFPGYEIRVETGQDQLRVRIQSPSAHYRGRIDQTYDLNRYQFVQGMTLESYILDTLTALSISAPVNSIPLIGGLIRMATRGTRFDHSFQEFYEILGGLEAATISPATTEQTARPSGKIDRGIRLIVDAYKKSAGSRPFRDDVFNKSLESVKQQIGDSLKDVLLEILTNDHWEEGLGLHTVETNFIINIAKTMLSRLVALRPDLADENVSKALREATARSPISRSEEAQYALANSIPEALERIQRRDPIRLDWKKYKGISDYMILAAPGSARSKIELKMVGGDSVNEGTVSFSQLQELFESLQTSVGVLEMERLENIKQGHADEPLEHGVDFRVAFGDFIKRHGLRFRSELRLTNVTDNVQTLYDMASQYSYSGVTPRLGLSESHLAAMLFFVENSPDLSTEVPAEIQALPNAPQLIQRFNLGSRVLNSFRAQFPEAPLVLQQMIHGAESFNLRDVVSGYGAYRETSRTEQAESITVVDQLPGLEIASQAGAAADRSFIAPKGVSAIGSVRATPFLSPAAMMELIRQGVDGVRPEQLVALLTMGFVPNANAATVAEVVSLIEPGIAESFRKIMDQYPQLASGNEPASVVVVTSDVPTAQELGLVQFMLAVNPGQSFRFVVPVFEDNQLETALAQVDTISESAKAWVDINGQPIGRERFRIFVQPLTTARGIKGFGGVLNGQINQLHSQLRIQNPDIAIGDHIAVMPMGVGRVQDLVTTSSIAARLLRNQSHEMSLRSAATFVGNRFAHYNGNAELLNAELIRQEDATEAVVVRGRDGYEINTASLSQLVSLIAQAQAEIMAAISA